MLPGLIEKTLERGWRAVIRTESSERADAIDNLLWTYNDQTFLAHAQSGDGNPRAPARADHGRGRDPNGANVLFCVGGAMPGSWDAFDDLTRVVLMFDGRDEAALARARTAWKDAKAAGHDVTYWKESPSGKFEKQG